MNDRFGKTNNRHQAIGEFTLTELACLLSMVKDYPNDYPDTLSEWKEWLEKESGKDASHL